MNTALLLATTGMTAWVSLYAAISGVALVRASRPRRTTAHPRPPSVLLVRPCTGDDDTLEPALRSTAAMHGHHADLRVVLTVESRVDPAWPLVRRAARWLRDAGLDAHAVVAPTHAYNRKVGQLAEVTRDAPEAVVMCVDADVDLSGFDLDAFVSPLASGTLGATWAPPVEVGTLRRAGDRASAAVLGASLHAFNLLGELDEGGLVGKTFAVRSDALRAAGGFDALTMHLGEDMELARRLRERGWPSVMHRSPVRAIGRGRSLSSVLARYTRWLWVIRAQRPGLLASYPLLLAAAPLMLCALAVLSIFAPGWGTALGAAVVSTRVAVALGAARPRGRLLDAAGYEWLLADLLLLLAFVRVFGRPEVSWRGRTLRLDAGGRLRALDSALGR